MAANPGQPLVGLIMGSKSDWPVLQGAADMLSLLGVSFEAKVVSAHRTPERLFDYAKSRQGPGPQSDHRLRWRRGAPAGHGGLADALAGSRRARAEPSPQRRR